MAIPRKVREQAEKAKEILANDKPEEEVISGDEGNEPVEDGDPNQESIVAAQQEEKEPDWKHKYQVIDGKYKHEVPRLQAELKELKQSNQQLMDAFRALQAQQTKEPEKAKKQSLMDNISSLQDEYPEDLLKALKSIAEDNERLRQEIDGLREGTKQTQQYSQGVAVSRYQEALLNRVPDAQEIFASPEFQEYLGKIEPLSGLTLQELLQNAADNLNVERTVAIFNGFKSPQTERTQRATRRNAELENQVSPGRGSSVPQKPEPKSFKASEVSEFYTQAAKGRIPKDKFKDMNAQINRALAEGRIT